MIRTVARMIAATLLLASLGACKEEPCKKACDNLLSMAQKKGQLDTAKEPARCLEVCSNWPAEVKECIGEAEGDAALGACVQKAFKIDLKTE
jgi:hypothetical protein